MIGCFNHQMLDLKKRAGWCLPTLFHVGLTLWIPLPLMIPLSASQCPSVPLIVSSTWEEGHRSELLWRAGGELPLEPQAKETHNKGFVVFFYVSHCFFVCRNPLRTENNNKINLLRFFTRILLGGIAGSIGSCC